MIIETVTPSAVGQTCGAYAALGYRLQTMVGTDERAQSGAYVLRYVLVDDAARTAVECRVNIPADEPSYSSATPHLPAANWYEREVNDLLGVRPIGHPQLQPLVLHGERLIGQYPLRKDFDVATALPPVVRTGKPAILPDGFFEVPVGPIHAGVIEPGHFRFTAQGEIVHALRADLFYTHRGLEKRAEGMRLEDGLQVAEQACGVCSVSHALSYAQAVESLAGLAIPEKAVWIRVALAELERLYNHVGDVGNICNGIGFSFGAMQGARLKEQLQQLNHNLVGHRFLRGAVLVGGAARDLGGAQRDQIRSALERLTPQFASLVDVILGHEIVCDRLRGVGILAQETARQLGVVGPAVRACGIGMDARVDAPYGGYARLGVAVPTYPQGDVMARLEQRIAEFFVSVSLIKESLLRLEAFAPQQAAAMRVPLPPVEPFSCAIGISESPRGENVHFVMAGEHGVVERLRIRSASYANWPAVAFAATGDLIADFPLINKSFELCYACCDR